MLHTLRARLPGHLPRWVPFVLRVRWARAVGAGLPHRWHYLPSTRTRWQMLWSRLTWRLRRPEQHDRSDGRDYRGFTARVVHADDPMDPPAGAQGLVVSSHRSRGGELLHRVDFPNHDVTMPLPWPGIDLIR